MGAFNALHFLNDAPLLDLGDSVVRLVSIRGWVGDHKMGLVLGFRERYVSAHRLDANSAPPCL